MFKAVIRMLVVPYKCMRGGPNRHRQSSSNTFVPTWTVSSRCVSPRTSRNRNAPSDSTVTRVFVTVPAVGSAIRVTMWPLKRNCSQPQRRCEVRTHVNRLLGPVRFQADGIFQEIHHL